MSRSIRRHQQAVARVRKLAILATHATRYSDADAFAREGLWRGYHRLCMNEPGYWVHEMMTRPARARDAHACRLIECGRNPDEFVWGDNRKPHTYYW